MMSVVSIKPLHAFKTHLNFFYETCITFTTKIFFFLLLNVREQSDELLAECITSEAHANILATFNKHLQLLPLVCVQTQPCQSGVDSLRGWVTDTSYMVLHCARPQALRSGNILPGGFYDSSPICGQLLSFNPLSLVECLWSSCGNGIDYLFSRTYETKSHESVTVCTDMMQMMRRREK